MRRLSFVLALIACQSSDAPPAHLTHAMVGTYDVVASYTTHQTQAGVSAVTASLAGTLTVADTVEYFSMDDRYLFPDVSLTAAFCTAPGNCTAPQSWSHFTSLSSTQPVTFGFGGGTVHLAAPFANGGFSGEAWYWVGGSSQNRYDGTFVATRK